MRRKKVNDTWIDKAAKKIVTWIWNWQPRVVREALRDVNCHVHVNS